MANCNEQFRDFNSKIKLSDEKREELLMARNNLRERMTGGYSITENKQSTLHKMEFQSQGSFVMDTIIAPLEDDYDIDDGVYFIGNLPKEKRPSEQNFHDWVIKSIDRGFDDIEKITDRNTCVRVEYKQGFHVDLPIYYANNYQCPELADTKEKWLLSNPVEFIDWFEKQVESGFKMVYLYESTSYFEEYKKWLDDIRKNDAQLRRIVRYLKAWGDFMDDEMPPGIIMTILIADGNYVADERDDIALKNTLNTIYNKLKDNFTCQRPTTPKGENLFKNYSESRKNYFMSKLKKFTEDATLAVNNPNHKTSCYKWQKHLGARFSCANVIDDIDGANTYQQPAIIGSTAKSA